MFVFRASCLRLFAAAATGRMLSLGHPWLGRQHKLGSVKTLFGRKRHAPQAVVPMAGGGEHGLSCADVSPGFVGAPWASRAGFRFHAATPAIERHS